MLLRGKTAVVTGCNRGIGKAVTKVLAENGANIWACARKPDGALSDFLSVLARDNGVQIRPLYFDLADSNQIKEAMKTVVTSPEPVDILVNNAAIIATSLFQMTPIDKMKEMFEVNFFSQLLITQYIVKKMSRQKSGSIIHLSSSAAIEANEGRTAYASSKAAMLCAARVMSKEFAVHGIRVNVLAPGLTETDMMRGSTKDDALEDTLKRTCMKRVGRPEEIANSVLFLASDLSSYMTGQVLRVDGGM